MLPHVCLSFPVSHWSIHSAPPATEFTLQCGTCWEQGFVSSSDQHRDAFLESQVSRHFMFPVAVANYPIRSFMFLEELPPICRETLQCSCESDLKTSFVTQQGLSEGWSKIENLSKDYLYLGKDKKVLELFTICFLPFRLRVCLLSKFFASLQSPNILEFARRVLSKAQNFLYT